jgi:Flp pilus assembly protein TadG
MAANVGSIVDHDPYRLLRDPEGSALVETAVVLPVALLFTFGLIQFCLYLACYVGATFASRVAVRYAIVHGSSSASPCTAATLLSLMQPYMVGIPQSSITVTPAWNPDNNAGSTITVTVSLSFATAIPFDQARTLTSTATASGVIVD